MSQDGEGITTGSAWHEWCDRLKAVGDRILGEEFPQAPRDRAEGFRWLTRLVTHAAQMEIEAGDPMFPRFVRYETPDQQWAAPTRTTRISARTSIRASPTACGPTSPAYDSSSCRCTRETCSSVSSESTVSAHSTGSRSVPTDGSRSSSRGEKPEQAPGSPTQSWIPMHENARILTIRIYQSDWERDAAPAFPHRTRRRGGSPAVRRCHPSSPWRGRSIARPHWVEANGDVLERATRRAALGARNAQCRQNPARPVARGC